MDSRIIELRRLFEGRPAASTPRSNGVREAAVALIVRPHDTLEVLLIRRAELEGDPWSGHIALPGGRRSAGDADLIAAAARETDEEVGIPLKRIGTFIGALDELGPASPRLPQIVVAPFIFAVPEGTAAHPDEREVQAALWVPVTALRDPGAAAEIEIDLPDSRRALPSVVYGDYTIWGLTLRVLRQFLELTETLA